MVSPSHRTLVNPAAVQAALSELQRDGLVEYQLALVKESDRYSADTLLVRVACAGGDEMRLTEAARRAVREVADVTPRVECVAPAALGDAAHHYKFKRFVDEREMA